MHTVEALTDGVAPEAVDAVRRRGLPGDPRMAALSALTIAYIEKRGHLDETDVKAFTSAGFSESRLFEVITGVAITATTPGSRPDRRDGVEIEPVDAGDHGFRLVRGDLQEAVAQAPVAAQV